MREPRPRAKPPLAKAWRRLRANSPRHWSSTALPLRAAIELPNFTSDWPMTAEAQCPGMWLKLPIGIDLQPLTAASRQPAILARSIVRAKVCPRMEERRWSGCEVRLPEAAPRPSTPWEKCISAEKAWLKTTRLRQCGCRELPHKAIQRLRYCSAPSTLMALA